jgi:uncharacterized membrane protein YccC
MRKQLIAVAVAAVSLSSAVGFALCSASSPQSADAATNADVVRELRRVNANLRSVNAKLGVQQQTKGSVRGPSRSSATTPRPSTARTEAQRPAARA